MSPHGATNPHGATDPQGATNPHAAMSAPGSANPYGGTSPHDGPPGAAEARGISGTLDLDPTLKGKVASNAVVFLTVREAGFGAGPPIAAKRMAAAFPLRFEIGPGDSMQGAPIPEKSLLEARVDTRTGTPSPRTRPIPRPASTMSRRDRPPSAWC